MEENKKPTAGKSCSICGKWHAADEYIYGNKSNRSYCRVCDREEKAAYTKGGAEAARQYREAKRASWQRCGA